MEDYNKIIESLGVKIVNINKIQVLRPVTVSNFYDVENTIILLKKGNVSFGEEEEKLSPGDILFVPSGKSTSVSYGTNSEESMNNDSLTNNMEKYLAHSENESDERDVFEYITFKANVFDSVNFFQSLDIPPFIIKNYSPLRNIIDETIEEHESETPGKDRIVKLNTEKMVIEIFRYILAQELFVEQLATNITYFKDPRLLDIFAFINENLDGDLTNKTLANVANVSEDYVGQYFKMLTGINPQDYIEYQRMEKAVNLLRTTKRSVREIGQDVGYKDTAYFCRRFKMMFGIPAGKMRRRETLMNI